MDVKIIADILEHEQARVAVLEDNVLVDLFIEYSFQSDPEDAPQEAASFATVSRLSRQGDIFKARVETVVPAINAAFVSLTPKAKDLRHAQNPHNAFMYLGEAKNLKPGQNIIVQVTKNARQNKAPRVSSRISIPGRWLVIVPDSDELGISRRIEDNQERKRLKNIALELKASVPGYGVVIRTAAEGVSEELLRRDLQSLLTLWHDIESKAKTAQAPCLLYRDMGTLGRVLRDDVAGRIDQIIINDPEELKRVESFIARFFPDKPDLLLHTETTPIFDYYGIEQEITKALDRKVWLRSGAYLVIDQTEALTVIDVNSGKFTSAQDMRHTTLAVNLEAASEIARQLRLRSIGGIVVVDFIDMNEENDKQELLKHFTHCLARDRHKAKIFSITQLGLVELTRKRERPDLRSLLTRSCTDCGGSGAVEREESIIMRIKRFVRKVTTATNAEAYVLGTSRHIAECVCPYIDEWELEFSTPTLRRRIFVVGMHDLHNGRFRLDFQGSTKDAELFIKKAKASKSTKNPPS